MPRLDLIHHAVKNALINDGWKITHDPFTIQRGRVRLQADLAAERPFAAEREGRRIIVEVKSFIGKSLIRELEQAIGQFFLYQQYLQISGSDRKLYLALSDAAYARLISLNDVEQVLQALQIAQIHVNLDQEEIVRWIN